MSRKDLITIKRVVGNSDFVTVKIWTATRVTSIIYSVGMFKNCGHVILQSTSINFCQTITSNTYLQVSTDNNNIIIYLHYK